MRPDIAGPQGLQISTGILQCRSRPLRFGVSFSCVQHSAAGGDVVAKDEQRHQQPCKMGGLGRAHLPNLASQWKFHREVKLYTQSGQSRYVGGGR